LIQRRDRAINANPHKAPKPSGPINFGIFLFRFPVVIILFWLLSAILLNALIPQLEGVIEHHAGSFLPDDSASVQTIEKMGHRFGDAGSNNFGYMLLESEHRLDDKAHAFYASVLSKLNSDHAHVLATMDLWSNPSLAPASESADGKAAYVLINLRGNMGTALAGESTESVRNTIAESHAPPGVNVFLTGPSVVVNDEFAAMGKSITLLLIACAALISVVLLCVYRSVSTAAVPLLSVALALLVARPIVALLGDAGIIGVSLFASALMSVVTLGAGANYGVFLVGRYQEARRAGSDSEDAFHTAISGVLPIIIASALTVAGATACMSTSRLSIFSTSGLPCAIGVLTALAAALTLGPALLAIGSRFGFFEPRSSIASRRWRHIATAVVRWPQAVLIGSVALTITSILVIPSFAPSYNEQLAQPANSEANRGFAAADRHFPPNSMAPSILLVEADHDMRNPADLIALSKVATSVAHIRNVSAVQSVTRPLSAPILRATLPSEAGYAADRIQQLMLSLGSQVTAIDDTRTKAALVATVPALSEVTSFLTEMRSSFVNGSPSDLFYLPSQAQASPLFKAAVTYFFTPDGKMTRIIVTPRVQAFSVQAMRLSQHVVNTAADALRDTSLAGSTVSIGGAGGTLIDLAAIARQDFIAIAIASLALVFCVVLVLLRAVVA
jgi:RND superfamily putative drug exporter